jgi:hypothetical protein
VKRNLLLAAWLAASVILTFMAWLASARGQPDDHYLYGIGAVLCWWRLGKMIL